MEIKKKLREVIKEIEAIANWDNYDAGGDWHGGDTYGFRSYEEIGKGKEGAPHPAKIAEGALGKLQEVLSNIEGAESK